MSGQEAGIPVGVPAAWLRVVSENLASLNDITAEMVTAVCADPEFARIARRTLRAHSEALGFTLSLAERASSGEPR